MVNYDVPHDPEDYIHRIGRTARAAATGAAVTLVCQEEQGKFHRIEKFMEREVEKTPLPESVGEGPAYTPEAFERKGRGGRSGRSRGGAKRGRGRSDKPRGEAKKVESKKATPVADKVTAPATTPAPQEGTTAPQSQEGGTKRRRHRGGRHHRRKPANATPQE